MAKDDDSEGLGLLIGMGKPKKSPEGGGGDEAKMMAAKAFLKAIKRDSPEALATAFEELLAQCDDDYDSSEAVEADDEEE